MNWTRAAAGAAAGMAAGLAGLTVRYAAGVARVDRSWPVQVESVLRDLGEVDEVSILPLVERHTIDGRGLVGEPGVVVPGLRRWYPAAVRRRPVRRPDPLRARPQRRPAR